MRDAVPAALWIKIGVEDAGTAAELELEAIAFADLERRLPEMADQLIGCEAENLPRLRRRGLGLRNLLSGRLLLEARGATREDQGRGEN